MEPSIYSQLLGSTVTTGTCSWHLEHVTWQRGGGCLGDGAVNLRDVTLFQVDSDSVRIELNCRTSVSRCREFHCLVWYSEDANVWCVFSYASKNMLRFSRSVFVSVSHVTEKRELHVFPVGCRTLSRLIRSPLFIVFSDLWYFGCGFSA